MLTKMKPEQSVYNKLHKFSAKEEPMKVEMGSIDDLKSQMKSANASAIQGFDMVQKAESLFSKSLAENKRLLASFQKALSLAKELGVKPAIDDVNKAISQVETNIKEIEQMLKAVNQI
jgi:conjugal transfer/entry exclusion protein